MVAVIKSGCSIRATFHYNENKVKEGIAECLMAANYPIELEGLSEDMRLNRLLKLAERNENVKRGSIHISLNFAPEEQHPAVFLKQLAEEYMDRIGFGQQPYLVYRHYDSGHPHIHILTTKVKADGRCIDTQNIGKNCSEPARKAMEIKYGLVKAEDYKKEFFTPKAVNAATVLYGKVPTKRAISSILSSVLDRYKYTSLAELNAVLKLYNVVAERGEEGSRHYKNKGLAYRIIGPGGRPVSTPIKASAFHQKALLRDIEARFLRNDVERHKHRPSVRNVIDKAFNQPGVSLESLRENLKKSGIDVVLRQNESGLIYGITYIDHRSRCIYNGSDLGKQYSAKAVLDRCTEQQAKTNVPSKQLPESNEKARTNVTASTTDFKEEKTPDTVNSNSLIEELMKAEYDSNYLPYELRKTRKKRKKRTNRL